MMYSSVMRFLPAANLNRLVIPSVVIAMMVAGCQGDRMVKLSAGIYLSWDGTTWAVLDGRNRGKGIEETEGGIVIVQHVNAIAVVPASDVIGRTDDGRYFVVPVKSGSADAVQWFETEASWLDHLRSAGVKDIKLHPPKSF
jgi:hypothetical protein